MQYPILSLLLLSPSHQGTMVRPTSSPECQTIAGDSCVFPFTFQGVTYYACTTDHSDNGSPWCAVQVRDTNTRTVLAGKWEDCSPQCPGYDPSGRNYGTS